MGDPMTKIVNNYGKKVYHDVVNCFNYQNPIVNVDYGKDNITEKKEDYQIAICQDGKFAVTFDTGKKKK
jgi:hypothetical protein